MSFSTSAMQFIALHCSLPCTLASSPCSKLDMMCIVIYGGWLWVTVILQRATDGFYQVGVIWSILSTVYCLQSVVQYLLYTVYYLLPTVYFPFCTVHCLLSILPSNLWHIVDLWRNICAHATFQKGDVGNALHYTERKSASGISSASNVPTGVFLLW